MRISPAVGLAAARLPRAAIVAVGRGGARPPRVRRVRLPTPADGCGEAPGSCGGAEDVVTVAKCRELFRKALEAARQIGHEYSRAAVLSAVAGRLHVTALPSLAKDFRSFVGQDEAVNFLNTLGSHWPAYLAATNMSSADAFAYWLDPLSRQSRSHLLRALGALIPALLHAGGKHALLEATEAISDTARWWR
jgi:hypothetical protein